MNKRRFEKKLLGKVKITKAPKRLFLEKGELTEIYDSTEPIRHIAYVEFLKGKTRGGHYHTRAEFFYVIRGKMMLEVIDAVKGKKARSIIKEGDIVLIPPEIAHSFKTIEPGHIVEFSQKRFNAKDTIVWKT